MLLLLIIKIIIYFELQFNLYFGNIFYIMRRNIKSTRRKREGIKQYTQNPNYNIEINDKTKQNSDRSPLLQSNINSI